jgi:hypothetical protein
MMHDLLQGGGTKSAAGGWAHKLPSAHYAFTLPRLHCLPHAQPHTLSPTRSVPQPSRSLLCFDCPFDAVLFSVQACTLDAWVLVATREMNLRTLTCVYMSIARL